VTRIDAQPRKSADPTAKVVDLTAYREARLHEADRLPLFVRRAEPSLPPRRVLSDNEVAHRTLMLRHLEAGLR
jgi:hypothetical protein